MQLYQVLIFLFSIVASLIFLLSALKLKIHRKQLDLNVEGFIEDERSVEFKLTLNENRPMIRENNGILPYFCCKSYSTKKMMLYKGHFCLNGRTEGKVYESSLRFANFSGLKGIQLIATDSSKTSQRRRYSGILGLSHLDECGLKRQDPHAPVNVIRKDLNGFTIDLPRLIFTSKFDAQFQTPFDGMFFEIVGFKLGPFHFPMKLNVKIDLETNEYKIPAEFLSHFKDFDSDYKIDSQGFSMYESFLVYFWEVDECWFEFEGGAKMNLPLNEKGKISIDYTFRSHQEDWISFGLYFLDHFAVSFDLTSGKIYFSPKS